MGTPIVSHSFSSQNNLFLNQTFYHCFELYENKIIEISDIPWIEVKLKNVFLLKIIYIYYIICIRIIIITTTTLLVFYL